MWGIDILNASFTGSTSGEEAYPFQANVNMESRIEFRMGQLLEKIPFGGVVDSIVAAEGINQQLIQAEFMSWVAGYYYNLTQHSAG